MDWSTLLSYLFVSVHYKTVLSHWGKGLYGVGNAFQRQLSYVFCCDYLTCTASYTMSHICIFSDFGVLSIIYLLLGMGLLWWIQIQVCTEVKVRSSWVYIHSMHDRLRLLTFFLPQHTVIPHNANSKFPSRNHRQYHHTVTARSWRSLWSVHAGVLQKRAV